jgi:hypothetical protein
LLLVYTLLCMGVSCMGFKLQSTADCWYTLITNDVNFKKLKVYIEWCKKRKKRKETYLW